MSVELVVSWGVGASLAVAAIHFGYRVVTGVPVRGDTASVPVAEIRAALTAAFLLMAGLALALLWNVTSSLHGAKSLPTASLTASTLVIGAAAASVWQWSRVRAAFEALEGNCRIVRRLAGRTDAWLGHTSIDDLHLTPRELEVLKLICGGTVSDAAVAAALVISPHTAGTHVRNILAKTELSDRRNLMLLGLASLPDDEVTAVR